MMNTKASAGLRRLAGRASEIRNNAELRHTPNARDLRLFRENAEDMACPQFQSIRVEKDEEK
jgi:hypothetical protein